MRTLSGNIAAVIFSLLVFASPDTLAQQVSVSPEARAAQEQVLAVEEEYVVAEVSRDEEALRRLIDGKFVQNSADGTTSGKEELIQSVLKLRMLGRSVRERTVLIEGNVALVFGTADLRFGGPGQQERVSTQRYTSTYVNRDGQWRLLALQMQQRSDEREMSIEGDDAQDIED